MAVMGVTKEPNKSILSDLLEAVKGADNDVRKQAWASIQDPDVLDALADEWRSNNERLSSMLSTIETVPGQVGRARNLRSAIKRLADERMQKAIDSQVSLIEQEILALIPVSKALGDSAPPASVIDKAVLDMLRIPRGYESDVSGVYKISAGIEGDIIRGRIAPAPIFISGRTIDVLTGEAKRQVVWRGPAGWCSRVIDRRTILDTSRIMTLADLEAPVSSNHIAQVVSYLADFEAENNHRFPAVQSASRMGWLPDGGFLLPDQHYTLDQKPSSFALTSPPGLETISQGWQKKGQWGDWRAAVEGDLAATRIRCRLQW